MLVMTGHAKKLSDLGIVIPNRLGINRVLQSPPPSYKNFVMNYNMQNMNKEFPELFGMLKAAEIEIKKEHQVLMVNKTSFKKQGKSKGKFKKGGKKAATPPMKPKNGPKPDADCYYCKEKGHWKRNCSKYLADLKSGLVKKKKEGMEHWTAVKNILKYLKRTKDMFLCYGGDQELVVTSYTDASWNTDPDDSKSQSGYVFILNGAAVSWASSKQCTVAKSSTESEYIAASEASSKRLAKLRRTSTPPPTPRRRAVGFKRSYYFRCPLEREVDVVFINNRTCDRVRRCCPFVAPEPIVIKIFYALLQAASERLPQQQEPPLVGFGISSRVSLDNPLVATVF
ncbi:hypothetical protein QYE76_042849 [Lolium multiflorum]|uniref:CCHC-type domain-containing protein n=1 Tax=Lolium multiflorum TaxID=4521 RepID=A0AAD8THZ3_LOLMU|nr:hypothetical protein QYE76_042849 [Lolium multiflorum]